MVFATKFLEFSAVVFVMLEGSTELQVDSDHERMNCTRTTTMNFTRTRNPSRASAEKKLGFHLSNLKDPLVRLAFISPVSVA